jgi:hypothetical protein
VSIIEREGIMASTGRHDCICGYPAISSKDLDEHCIAMASADDSDDHAAAN